MGPPRRAKTVYLLMKDGSDTVIELTTERLLWMLGRHPACDLVLDDPGISRFHATIFYVDEDLFVVDHSINGTHVPHSQEELDAVLSESLPLGTSAAPSGDDTQVIEPFEGVIEAGEVVLCDFGATMIEGGIWACSDITRCVWLGEPPTEFVELYDVLFEAQAAGVAAAEVGTPAEDVDRACRKIIADPGYGDYFVHRTGHGIGFEAHEDPYIVEGNSSPLVAGNAFSVEPGIYVPGKWGARLEDIVVATEAGPEALNKVDHHLAVIDV